MKNSKAVLLVSVLAVLAASSLEAHEQPRLVVQITVDQLRGDLPLRYWHRFGAGGFRYFLDRGTWYTDAQHPHSMTETVVGHTTLATGAYPSRHGMVANSWFDSATNKLIDNIEGPTYPLISVMGETQTGPGASPVRILTTTFSDELAIATDGQAKIYSVSVKDRGAIPLAGHAGKAYWYSNTNGCFVSSTFYYPAPAVYPPWVKSWCEKKLADKHANSKWILSRDRSTYLYKNFSNVYPSGSYAAQNMDTLANKYMFGSTFPHTFGSGPALYGALPISPIGDELTADFAKQIITGEQLGKDSVTDYLAISFSATDLLAHWFSPASLESEDNILRLDATLAGLLAFIDRQVGLKNTIVVLSGDHGGVEYPEYLTTLGINTGRLTPDDIEGAAEDAVKAQWPNIVGDISTWSQPSFYINQQTLAANKLNQAEVEQVMADGVMTLEGVAMALTRTDMRSGVGDLDPQLVAQVRRNYNPSRSGDVYVVQQPQWQILEVGSNDEGPSTLLQHGSPWTYDTYVPVAFAGMNVPATKIARRIYTVDVAATLSSLIWTKIPSGCVGVPLTEVVPLKSPLPARGE
ncbi:MAG TPA: alkaline phosphatase family protein, partial [Thermoanaerobaculia bacterium]|nr:alkaline phosphatase family protein [Thermoanaerobaculia bacterium]